MLLDDNSSGEGEMMGPFSVSSILIFLQIFFIIIVGVYFFNLLKNQQGNKMAVGRESRREIEKLNSLRRIKLSEPLAERTAKFPKIIGQGGY